MSTRATVRRGATPAAVAVLMLLVWVVATVSATAAGATTSHAKRARDACTRSVDGLTAYLGTLDQAAPVIHRPKVYATFVTCRTADAWRLRGERADIGPKLGALLGSPTLDTDRALDVLCQHFDAYDRTSTCKNRNGPDTQGSTTG